MITNAHLLNCAFPWVITDGKVMSHGDGILCPYPPLLDMEKTLEAAAKCAPGWHTCPNSLAIYCTEMNGLEQRLALFGLRVRGYAKRRGKESALGEVFSIFAEKETIEEYVSNFQDGIQKINEEYSAFLRSAVHEVRGINADIYNSSYELEQILSISGNNHPTAVAGNIVRLSELLKIRTDTIDVFRIPHLSRQRESQFRYSRNLIK